ncbi:hypothetical protein BCR33DRAFT_851940 [Rhizoclosmatium globosum]|uniref:VASt domain-containing protein n=1 Tax=Rhizoclosmatium globosum TaxID=329046 RepID=A0A1Y2C4F6_9FUNG|nr:hypothetical protein BCR33DRAFT_851940 [Rhizoclosmatium globosum]|eukprot:ORY41918.1 hypothetical protein BCR33DRAFT_851940 [Rhizoclosmatium globosum]
MEAADAPTTEAAPALSESESRLLLALAESEVSTSPQLVNDALAAPIVAATQLSVFSTSPPKNTSLLNLDKSGSVGGAKKGDGVELELDKDKDGLEVEVEVVSVLPSSLPSSFYKSAIDVEGGSLRSADAVAMLRADRILSSSLPPSSSLTSLLQPASERSSTTSATATISVTPAPANTKRNKDFHDLFPDIPEEELLLEDWSCAWQREVLIQGRMYLTDHHICFNANIFGWTHSLVLDLDDIVSVEKKSIAGFIPNSIEVSSMLGQKYYFASFIARDATFEYITRQWGNSSRAIRMKTFNREKRLLMDDPETTAATDSTDESEYVAPMSKKSSPSKQADSGLESKPRSSIDAIGMWIRGGSVSGPRPENLSRPATPDGLSIIDRRLSAPAITQIKGLAELATTNSPTLHPSSLTATTTTPPTANLSPTQTPSTVTTTPLSEDSPTTSITSSTKNIHVVHQKHVVVLPPAQVLLEPTLGVPAPTALAAVLANGASPAMTSPPDSPGSSIIDLTPHLESLERRKAGAGGGGLGSRDVSVRDEVLKTPTPAGKEERIEVGGVKTNGGRDTVTRGGEGVVQEIVMLQVGKESDTSSEDVVTEESNTSTETGVFSLSPEHPVMEVQIATPEGLIAPKPTLLTKTDSEKQLDSVLEHVEANNNMDEDGIDAVVWIGAVRTNRATQELARSVTSSPEMNPGVLESPVQSEVEDCSWIANWYKSLTSITWLAFTSVKLSSDSLEHRAMKRPGSPLKSSETIHDDDVPPEDTFSEDALPEEQASSSPSPSRKGPTTCPCAEKQAKLTPILTATYPNTTLEAVWTALYSTPNFTAKFVKERRGVTSGHQSSEWRDSAGTTAFPSFTPDAVPDPNWYTPKPNEYPFPDVTQGLERRGENVTPLTNPMGPKSTRCFVCEVVDVYRPDECLCIWQSTVTPDVPSGTSFFTRVRICWTRCGVDGDGVRVEVGCEAEFVKSSWIQGIIQAAVIDGMKTYYKDFDEVVRNTLKEATAAAKLKPKRVEAEKTRVTESSAKNSLDILTKPLAHPLEDELDMLDLQVQEKRRAAVVSLLTLEVVPRGFRQRHDIVLPPRGSSLRLKQDTGLQEVWRVLGDIWNILAVNPRALAVAFAGLVMSQVLVALLVFALVGKNGPGVDHDTLKRLVAQAVSEVVGQGSKLEVPGPICEEGLEDHL